MKALLPLSLLLALSLLFASCKKSDNSSKYLQPRDTVNYYVKSGTMTVNENGRTTTYTAPDDDIIVWLVNEQVEIRFGKRVAYYDTFDFGLKKGINGEILEHFTAGHQLYDKVTSLMDVPNSSMKVSEYNNTSDGVFIKASFTCTFTDLNVTPNLTYPVSGNMNVLLNKKM